MPMSHLYVHYALVDTIQAARLFSGILFYSLGFWAPMLLPLSLKSIHLPPRGHSTQGYSTAEADGLGPRPEDGRRHVADRRGHRAQLPGKMQIYTGSEHLHDWVALRH